MSGGECGGPSRGTVQHPQMQQEEAGKERRERLLKQRERKRGRGGGMGSSWSGNGDFLKEAGANLRRYQIDWK